MTEHAARETAQAVAAHFAQGHQHGRAPVSGCPVCPATTDRTRQEPHR
jgi:hypothetical protein